MSRHGARRGERSQKELPAPAAETSVRPPTPAMPPTQPGGPEPTPTVGLHWTWKVATVVFAGTFLILLLSEWLAAIYRMTQ
jgi:hypothetical protein